MENIMNLDIIDYLAIVTSIATLSSICINVIQWQSRKIFSTTLKSRSQAAFNYFYRIASNADKIRALALNQENPNQTLWEAKQYAFSINGLSDAARLDISSYSREHLNFVPVNEHPANPFAQKLPKPNKNQ
jgi:hypothetical protein